MIYLDNAATTYPKPECVYRAMDEANRNLSFNAGRGSYKKAREATRLLDDTRKQLLKLVGAAHGGAVIFSPSITVALNQILNGLDFVEGDNIYVSPYEHNAVARTVHLLEKNKRVNVIKMPLNTKDLTIDIDKLQYMFSKEPPKCVCCIQVSNVTGYILPIEKIFNMAKKHQAITILDSAQSLGVIDIDAERIRADYIAFAGHKSLYGPFGVGGFIKLDRDELFDYFVGGTGSVSLQLDMPDSIPERYEPSSHNIVAIAGLNAALKNIDVEEVYLKEKEMTKYLVEKLKAIDGIVLYLPPEEFHLGIVSFNIEGYRSEDIGMILDEDYDIAVRTGYHCAPYVHEYLSNEKFLGTVRISVGRSNTADEIDAFVRAISEI